MNDDPLDNPVWYALTGPHAHLALGQGAARRYPPDVAPHSAILEPTEKAYADLAADLPPDVDARLFRPADEDAPPGWETLSARPIVQMTLDRSELLGSQPADVHISPLTVADVAETLELAKLARPGPFAPRVLLLGGFIGIRDAATGRLIAMGGERFRMSGHVELSAIAVHPNARGRGYGAALTGALARAALARGEIPFLHVYPDNPAASIYTRLGFRERRTLWVFVRRRRGRW